MKRIALLLAGAVLGTGCVVDTCDPVALDIAWFPTDVDKLDADCIDTGGALGVLSTNVNTIDLFVDDLTTPYLTLNCTDYGVVLNDLEISAGTHDIMLEGRFNSGSVVIRDMVTKHVDSCGTTLLDMYPGEAILRYDASYCVSPRSSTTDFQYSLDDINYASPIALATNATVACGAGYEIDVGPVPYGYYDIVYAEEFDGMGYAGYANCSSHDLAVFVETPMPATLPMTQQAQCP